MARPLTKEQLLRQSRESADRVDALLDSMSPTDLSSAPEGCWSPKDIVAHLSEWERMLLGWHESAQRGEKVVTPAPGYTWRQIDGLNEAIYERHKDDPVEQVRADWKSSRTAMLALVEGLSEDDLFARARYPWTGSSSAAAYVHACGDEHYDWAAKLIRSLRK